MNGDLAMVKSPTGPVHPHLRGSLATALSLLPGGTIWKCSAGGSQGFQIHNGTWSNLTECVPGPSNPVLISAHPRRAPSSQLFSSLPAPARPGTFSDHPAPGYMKTVWKPCPLMLARHTPKLSVRRSRLSIIHTWPASANFSPSLQW